MNIPQHGEGLAACESVILTREPPTHYLITFVTLTITTYHLWRKTLITGEWHCNGHLHSANINMAKLEESFNQGSPLLKTTYVAI